LSDDPNNVVILDYLADSLARAGRNQEALEIASRAAALGHNSADFVKLMRNLRAAQT
jgi:predicted Zn-dependent protease